MAINTKIRNDDGYIDPLPKNKTLFRYIGNLFNINSCMCHVVLLYVFLHLSCIVARFPFAHTQTILHSRHYSQIYFENFGNFLFTIYPLFIASPTSVLKMTTESFQLTATDALIY